MKAATVHHPIIQNNVDELFARGSTEPWMGGAGFYLTLNNLTALCTYLLLRYLLSHRCGTLFNIVIMFFFLSISKILIYIFLLLNITIVFYGFFGNTNLFSGRFCLWVSYSP